LKNIKIDDRKNDHSHNENIISVSKSNKKDNKFETIESKKENIMKIPKVFHLKYSNLGEKKSQANELSDKSNTKITSDPSVNDSNEKGNNINSSDLSKSDLDKMSNNNLPLVEEKNKDLVSKDNKNNASNQVTSNLDKPISLIMPVNKFNTILKQKINIIDHVPVCVNNDFEKEDSFRINVVSNDGNQEKPKQGDLMLSAENQDLGTFINKNSNLK